MSHVVRWSLVVVGVSVLALSFQVWGQQPQSKEPTDRPTISGNPQTTNALYCLASFAAHCCVGPSSGSANSAINLADTEPTSESSERTMSRAG